MVVLVVLVSLVSLSLASLISLVIFALVVVVVVLLVKPACLALVVAGAWVVARLHPCTCLRANSHLSRWARTGPFGECFGTPG